MTLCRRFLVLTVAAACSHPAPQPTAPSPEPATAAAAPSSAPAPAAAKPADPYAAIDAAGKAITGDFLREQITRISSDEFEGRGPTTKGDQLARAYIAEQLKAMGYEPGDGTSWEQPVEVVGIKPEMPAKWTFSRGGKSVTLAWWDQFIARSGVQSEHAALKNAELVF